MCARSFRPLFALLLVLACVCPANAEKHAPAATLSQVGVIDALLAGGYEGSLSIGELRRVGDLGLGTFDALDGEMVLLEGIVYQVPYSGIVRKAPDTLTTPFAQAVRFAPTDACTLTSGADLHAVEAVLDAALGDANVFAAVRIDTTFASLKARSVPRQSPPYRPLAEVAKGQSVFPMAQVQGTLIGLRGTAFVRGLGVPGWHWHFLTADRTRGGHVLTFTLGARQATAHLQRMRRMVLVLPERGLSTLDLGSDRASELKAVESGK